MLQEYARNPLVLDAATLTMAGPVVDDPSSGSQRSRHLLGFGFSKDMPYLPPGTIVRLSQYSAKISGMVVAYGQRMHEYAVLISFEEAVHADAASALLLPSYNLTEIDGGDDGLCECLAMLIGKYTYVVGDVDPLCASTDAMESSLAAKFDPEMQRMLACVNDAVLLPTFEATGKLHEEKRSKCIADAFAKFTQVLRMQMRHQPLGTREWMQMFESFMAFECANELGFVDFVLR